MNPGMKMLMIQNRDDRRGERGGAGRDYGRNEMESRYRDNYDVSGARYNRGGRSEGDNDMESRYGRAEMNYRDVRGDYDAESAFYDRRGRRHYDNGRFAPMRGEMEGNMEPYSGAGDKWRIDWERARAENQGPREVMGFRAGNVVDFPRGNEMEHRRSDMEMGKASGSQKKLDKQTTERWMEKMKNEDGSSGPHWTREQVQQLMSQRRIEQDPLEFWAALNIMYSDYCKVAKKNNINTMDFYIDMAEAFLNDKDAKGDKLSKYYYGVVQG